jgi:hypothetical protein
MPRPSFQLSAVIVASLLGLTALHAQSAPAADEAPFLAENDAAMDKMMADMNIKPSGDVDVDFAAMMIPHHQGAIEMALAELRHGKNEQLRRIAQEIVVEQQQEIIAMRMALGQPLPPSAPSPTQPAPAAAAAPAPDHQAHDHSTMSHDAMSSMKK